MRFAIVDLECSELHSDAGHLICGGIKELGKPPVIIGLADVKRNDDPTTIDEALALRLREELEKFDGWITWNGKLFDVPFLNDRLTLCGHDLLEKRFHLDMMWFARMGQSRMKSSRLGWVAAQLGVKAKKTDLDIKTWKRASAEALRGFKGGKSNYQYIIDHNRADLYVTEGVYGRLKNRVQNIHK